VRRIVIGSLVGTTIEFYDFYIYATAAALVFGTVFFPKYAAGTQSLAALATFGIAFIARPFGAMLFGHFGDRVGRKSTLVASLLTMGISTAAIGLLPGYDAIGWLAPALLCVMRLGQGIGLGGEWGGAALLAVENAPPGRGAWFGMFPQLGPPAGFLLSNGLFLLLDLTLGAQKFAAWGWRIPGDRRTLRAAAADGNAGIYAAGGPRAAGEAAAFRLGIKPLASLGTGFLCDGCRVRHLLYLDRLCDQLCRAQACDST
jgi:MFS family permease